MEHDIAVEPEHALLAGVLQCGEQALAGVGRVVIGVVDEDEVGIVLDDPVELVADDGHDTELIGERATKLVDLAPHDGLS